MGNQAINHDLRNVVERDFDDKLLDPYLGKLWTFEDLDKFKYHRINWDILSTGDKILEKQFPTQCKIEEYSEENMGETSAEGFTFETTLSSGFTTGEKKIDMLRQEGKFSRQGRPSIFYIFFTLKTFRG